MRSAARGDPRRRLTRQFSNKQLRFYLTAPSACPYLPDRRERKVFTSLDGPDAVALNEALTQAGFRRSQNIAYRPACEGCDACVSARIPVRDFVLGKRWRRVLARNGDIVRRMRPAEATEDQFWLLRRYLMTRHGGGGMADMTLLDYAAMVEETSVRTHIVEYARTQAEPERGVEGDDLIAAALVDVINDGLSLVYSFFDVRESARSLGSFIILDHIAQAAAAGLPYVYLGYWVKGSDKMGYKGDFRPLEILRGGEWRRVEGE